MPKSSGKSYIFQLNLKRKCPSGSRKISFCFLIFIHAWLILNSSNVSLPPKFSRWNLSHNSLLSKRKKHKLYLCWTSGFGNRLLFGLLFPLQNKVTADSVEDLGKVKGKIWQTTNSPTRRLYQNRCSLYCKQQWFI